MANVLKTYRDLKSKHPDALLLFRCGDFYETYGQDAKVVSEVLGITLTFRDLGEHIDMAGFPHHALDTYLPKIIRAGHRVAICDMPEPTTKLVRRGSDELTTTATNNRTNNHQTTESNMKLNLSNQSENQNVQNAQATNTTSDPIKVTESRSPEAFRAEYPDVADVDFEEVKPEPVAEEKPKKQPTDEEVKEEISAGNNLPQVQFSTYTTKRGDTAPQIIGFGGEDDPRWKSHRDAGHKYVSASYRRDLNGNKVYVLLFGTRYMDVAKALAGAYNTTDANAWHRAEDACMAIYEQAQRDGKARWEEKKAQWAEQKAEKDAQKAADEQAKRCYTKEDVATMLVDVLAGKDVPEDIKALLAKAA